MRYFEDIGDLKVSKSDAPDERIVTSVSDY